MAGNHSVNRSVDENGREHFAVGTKDGDDFNPLKSFPNEAEANNYMKFLDEKAEQDAKSEKERESKREAQKRETAGKEPAQANPKPAAPPSQRREARRRDAVKHYNKRARKHR